MFTVKHLLVITLHFWLKRSHRKNSNKYDNKYNNTNTKSAFCKSASHIPHPQHPEHPTSPTSHIWNIPHTEYPTCQASHILNTPPPEHHTSRTSRIPKSHILNIPYPQHPTSPTSYMSNILQTQDITFPISPTFQITRILSSLSKNFRIHARESLNIHSRIFEFKTVMGSNPSQIHILLLYRSLIGEIFKNKQ